ncbi:hypothetical protein [Novosphingobium capsulatum]|uniref:hypothetical protein n=1 Tax=Novosphingobium capsulatum TaxID=13688 RepID=UPI0007874DBA|nr:hypothetical protein [Novosphingobium capsulatum]WQD92781.1 hypothetical protein U0041_17630 [Novosphingobium capsulatum]
MRCLILAPLGMTAFALAGCATKPIPPVIETRIERVDLPVAVPCVDAKDVPADPPRVGDQLTGDAVHDIGPVAASNLRLRAAFDKALALLQACAVR